MEGTTTWVNGIHLLGGNVASGTKIKISYCKFSIRAKNSNGIFLDGEFPASSETLIFENTFATGNPSNTVSSNGLRSSGNKNNLSVYRNIFTGNGYYNVGILAEGSSGVNNYIADNRIVDAGPILATGQFFSIGLSILNFQNTIYCSNINYFGSNYGFKFSGTNTGTVFTENKIYATAVGLEILDNALIGPQSHLGNEWHPFITQGLFGPVLNRASIHAHCHTPSLALLNRFTVHTKQSVWDTLPNPHYTFFSPFYPENIVPLDTTLGFFKADSSKMPSAGCSTKFNEPASGEELDKDIADELLPFLVGNPSMGWITKSYLYKKLKSNPLLVSAYSSFSTFLSNNANTNIGKFYSVEKKVEEAFSTTETLNQQSKEILSNMVLLLDNLTLIDSLLESTTNASALDGLLQTKSG